MNRTSHVVLVSCALALGFLNKAHAATVIMDWDPVSINTDGTPVTGLHGYRIFQAPLSFRRSGSFISVAEAMADTRIQRFDSIGTATTYTATLAEGATYYFRITALDNTNSQSRFNVDGFGNDTEISIYLPPQPTPNYCDLNGNGVSATDVQLCANQALGFVNCIPRGTTGSGDVNGDTRCNVIDVQRVINAVLGGPCVSN